MRALIFGFSLVLAGCTAPDRSLVNVTPIGAARALPLGTMVEIEGVVTVATGTFDRGFALEDSSGGIYVVSSNGRQLAIGDRVRLNGTLAAPDQQTSIDPSSLTLRGTATAPAAHEIKTGQAGTATEGRIISVCGAMVDSVQDDQPWGWKLYIDDGSGKLLVFVATATKIDVTTLRKGQSLRVTGFSGRYADHTEVLPRDRADIVVESR